jgi:transglutaminase-like putative cysteine protease
MSIIDVSSCLRYQVLRPTSFLFNVAAAPTEHQIVTSEHCYINGSREVHFVAVGVEGNRVLRLQAEPGDLELRYSARVRLEPQMTDAEKIGEVNFDDLPEQVLPYLNPSRYCESDRLSRLAVRQFGDMAPGHQRVQAICDWVHSMLVYLSGSTDARSSASDVLVQGAGVCRDYAHLAISLCRAICVPARYVSGYAVGLQPPDFHGFFEAYLDGGWYLFDATRMVSNQALVRIGSGRDASDAAFATIIGSAILQEMVVKADQRGGADEHPKEDQAVSTA